MPRLDAVDAAYPPTPAAMAAAGMHRKCRYLYESGKGYTVNERAQDRAHGHTVLKNFEAASGDLRGGYAVGRDQAQRARRCVQPDGNGPTVLSADYDLNRTGYGQVEQSIRGAQSVLGGDVRNGDGTGIYGEFELIEAMWDVFGPSIYYWQTYAWSGGRLSAHADLYQWRNGQPFAGATVDFNQVTGRWAGDMHAITAPTPAVAPAPVTEGDEVLFPVIGGDHSTHPRAVFIKDGPYLRWVPPGRDNGPGQTPQGYRDAIDAVSRFNSISSNGRVGCVNYQNGQAIDYLSFANLPAVDDLESLGLLIAPAGYELPAQARATAWS